MNDIAEPNAEDFFATDQGVSVYVDVRGHHVCVRYDAITDDHGGAGGANMAGMPEALPVADRAFRRCRGQLAGLFAEVVRIRIGRGESPVRFDVQAPGGVEGYAVVQDGCITVRGTKGAVGSKTTQLGDTEPTMLAELLLTELSVRKAP
jgi:hypothetical protein